MLRNIIGLEIISIRITNDVRTERKDEKWLNVLLQRRK